MLLGAPVSYVLDVDFVHSAPLTTKNVTALARLFQQCVQTASLLTEPQSLQVLILGTDRPHRLWDGWFGTNVHLKAPGVFVNYAQALALRDSLLRRIHMGIVVSEDSGDMVLPGDARVWEEALDAAVYVTVKGLRMLGSRKVKKGQDQGREYGLLCVLSDTGHVDEAAFQRYSSDALLLLTAASIRVL